VKDPSRPPSARRASVSDDWRAWLPDEKARVFDNQVKELESSYTMLSVSLNEAMELRQEGRLAKSLQAVGMTAGLCRLLTAPLASILHALSEHAKHYGTIPNAAPLDPANFRGKRGQRSARISNLLNHVLLSQRLQFLQKVSTLKELVEDLATNYRQAAGDLADGLSLNPGARWEELDEDHYDLNTCLREATVLLKSFLIVLPGDQLGAFQTTVQEYLGAGEADVQVRQRVLRHRRMTAVAGQ
jgi:hypothetical protein